MNLCLICNNKTNAYHTICDGCVGLLEKPNNSCQRCGNELHNHNLNICGTCQLSSPSFSHTYYACSYQFPIDSWIMAVKFGKKLVLTRMFAELMSPLLEYIDKEYVLMPVPLHKSRLRSRGYNQAYEIAKELSKLSTRKTDTSLIRQKNTSMQAQLKLKHRAKNVSNAFALKQELKHKKIILIDDVMTSGSTLAECAKTLNKAGAENVVVLVFARKSIV